MGAINNCYSSGNVTGAYDVGGLLGSNMGAILNNCYSTSNIIGNNDNIGGLVGSSYNYVNNCFATGNATGSSYVGGLVGYNNGGTVTNSYYSGTPVDTNGGIFSSYENFTSFAFVSGASGLNWNVGGTQDVITTEDDSSYIWKIIDGYTLPYLQYQEDPISLALAGTPESFTNTTGNFWVNHSWSAGTGDVTDSYNVSYGESWQNDTITYLNHTGLSAHAWSNITVYAYNATDSTLSPGASDNVQVPNNEIGILNVTNITSSEGETISFDINFTDIDGDTPTFDCNQSSLFDDFNTSTGEGSWDIGFSDAGTYYVEFNVSDGYDSVASQVMNITITNVPTMRVGSGSGYDYSSIQEAINDADDGDTIIVTDGIYNENVVVNKSVILRSENGSGSTIVNASDSSDHVFNVIVSNVTIDGFNVTGVNAINKAGIYLSYSDNCTVRNNIVNTNYDGIVLVNSNYNLLTSNVASNNYKNGIYLSSSDNNTFTSCIANFNEQYGFYLLSSNNNTLTDNVANNNTYRIESLSTSVDSLVEPMESLSDGAPTGFYISSSDNNILTDNTANYNTGGYQVFMTSVSNNVVSPDIADVSRYSSGFSLSSSYNTTLADNTAIGNEDYAFYSSYSYDNTVDKLKMAESSMQLSFVTDFSEMAVGDNESISSAPTGMSNVNGYIDAASWYDPNMTIYYDDSGMSSSVESSISLFKLNGSEWVKVPNASLSTSGNYVSVEYYRPQNNAFNGISIDDLTSTFGLFKSIPSSGSRSDDDGVRASVSQGQDPGIVSNSASSVKRVTGGSPVNYDFADSGTPVLGVSFDAKDDKGLVVSKVQVLSSAPEGVPTSSGHSYQMMSIDVGSEGTISSDSADNVMIHFKVSKQWIEENDIDLSTVRMTRYHGEQWNDLPTYQEREDGEYFYFYAETPGFSIFEVVGDEIGETSEQVAASESVTEEVEEPVENETPDTQGFTILAGVVFVSLAVLTSRK
jgi:PGF-pre-PGF domain-containing protein